MTVRLLNTSFWQRIAAVVVLLFVNRSQATSIVAQLTQDHIFIAADTRASALELSSSVVNENECKIIILRDAAFAVTGNMNYTRHDPTDVVQSWDSRQDAFAAFQDNHGNLAAAADDWARRATFHYSSFYRTNPYRVIQLASANTQGLLLRGMFAGFIHGKAVLLVRDVLLDARAASPVFYNGTSLPDRTLPYTSNGITQELIEQRSQRASAAYCEWSTIAATIPSKDRTVRHLEFLIRATARFDKSVGPKVNVLRIDIDHHLHWVRNLTCPEH